MHHKVRISFLFSTEPSLHYLSERIVSFWGDHQSLPSLQNYGRDLLIEDNTMTSFKVYPCGRSYLKIDTALKFTPKRRILGLQFKNISLPL